METRENPIQNEQKLSRDELQKMAAWMLEENRPKEMDPRSPFRKRIRNLLGGHQLGQGVLRRFSKTHQRQEDWLESQQPNFLMKLSDLEAANERGDLLVEREKGHVVSFVILKPLKTVGENPYVSGQVLELGRAFTIPSERGKGHYSRLRARAIQFARDKYPDASLISATSKEHVKKLNRRDGWTEISFAEFLQIYDDPSIDEPEWAGFYLNA